MPWIREDKLYLYVILLLIFIMAIRMPLDTDMWWHLKAGEHSWAEGQVYARDTFSHTRTGQGWINHSWLAQVLMYLIYAAGGYYGISIWVAICAVASLALVYPQMDGHPLLRSLVLILAGMVASVVWSPRPQVMSLVLFSLLSYLLYLYKTTGRTGLLGWVVPLFMIWANTHGGYVLGFILLGATIAGEVLNQILAKNIPGMLKWRQIGILVGLLLVSSLAVLLNPFGFDIWKIPFNTIGVETLQNLISEWASPDFHQAFQQPFMWLLFLVFASMALTKKQVCGTDLVKVVVFGWAALVARRNFGPFAIVTAPAASRYLAALLTDWLDAAGQNGHSLNKILGVLTEKRDLKSGLQNLINTVLLLCLLLAAGWKTYAVCKPDLIQKAEMERYPVKATAFLAESGLAGSLFNEYNWGGYLIWHLPEYPVFVDGRTDLFGDEILDDYLIVMPADSRWETVLETYGVNTLIIKTESTLSKVALLSGWSIEYRDDVATILSAE